jgi:UDP-glucuronate 4-epimerase
MKVLVTGCAGFIGSQLTELLLARGDEVVGIDCFNDNYGRPQKLENLRNFSDRENFEFVPIDLGRGDLEELVADRETIFHLAAEPGVRSSWGARYHQYVHNNILATQHLLDAAKDRPGLRVVYASSSSVYGDAIERPTTENAKTDPRSPYGQTKLSAEQLCALYHYNFDLDFVALRYFTVFGPRQRPDMAFHIFCRAALLGEPLTVFGDGRQTRDFTFVGDVVAGTAAAADAELDRDRIFNIGGGAPTSIREVLGMIGEISGSELDVVYQDNELGDVKDTAADTTLARKVLGFAPQVGVREGLEAEFEWLQARTKAKTAG